MPIPFVFETSYEIVHKVGGVETVVRSKIPQMVQVYKDNYYMLGPYIPEDKRYSTLFEDTRAYNGEWDGRLTDFERTFGLPQGFVRYGTWLVPGSPKVILLPVYTPTDGLMGQIRQKAVDLLNRKLSLNVYDFHNDGGEQFRQNAISFGIMQWCFFSYMMVKYITGIEDAYMVVQVHEWLAAVGQILFRQGDVFYHIGHNPGFWDGSRAKFVFTTHATTIGRHLSAGNADLNGIFRMRPEGGYADGEACKRGVVLEHRIEREAAHSAHVLTTVSEITNQECTWFLSRSADIITWNGLDVESQKGMVDDHELQTIHRDYKSKIHEFVRTYFSGIDVRNTQIFFTAGRNEYKNKGIDLFIDSLAYMRDFLDNLDYIRQFPAMERKTVVAFIIAPQANHGFTQNVLQAMNLAYEMKLAVEAISRRFQENLVNSMCADNHIDISGLKIKQILGKQDGVTLRQFQQTLKSLTSYSPITTHNIADEQCPILGHLRGKSLCNWAMTRVKVIFVPEFLSKTSIFGLDYPDFVRGAHLGVFSSLYEPFGYTSPECMCVGTASILSNLCGFGNMAELQIKEFKEHLNQDLISMAEERHNKSFKSMGDAVETRENQWGQQPQSSDSTNLWKENPIGVQVVDRVFKNYGETVHQQTMAMLDFLKLDGHERIALRSRMVRNATFIDWSVQIQNYVKAYDLAIQRQ